MDKAVIRHELKIALTNGSAILGAYILKRTTEMILESVFQKEPPKKPDEQEEIGWIEALGWAAFTGAMAGALKLIVRRGAKTQLDKLM
jgi:hypothetical protein